MAILDAIKVGTLVLDKYQVSTPEQISSYVTEVSNEITSAVENTYISKDKLSSIANIDYTAFEFYPTNEVISAGTSDSVTDLTYIEDVPANMTGGMTLYSSQPQELQNLIIDWGDGTVFNIKDIIPSSDEFTDHSGDDGIFIKSKTDRYEYQVRHTYETPGRYIVKIYGDKYYCVYTYLGTFKLGKSIVSRLFDKDLPLASCINSLASIVRGSLKLQRIDIPVTFNMSNIYNTALAFRECLNLITAVGFNNKTLFRNPMYVVGGMFEECKNLKTSDLILPRNITSTSQAINPFSKCESLEGDVLDLLPNKFDSSLINGQQLFYLCKKLTCSNYNELANRLWNDTNISWTNNWAAFHSCSDELRSHVPTSWGGTSEELEAELQLIRSGINKSDYTAFEVFAHDYDIPVGDCEELGGYVNNAISAQNKMRFKIRTTTINPLESDVIVDWGDGNISKVVIGEYETVDIDTEDKEANYTFYHEYADNGKYIIKIYGRKYYNIIQDTECNLVCRIIDDDLPIASNVTNLTRFCQSCNHLLHIKVPTYFHNSEFINAFSMFRDSKNLISVSGIGDLLINIIEFANIFDGCISLETCDFKYPKVQLKSSGGYIFRNCSKLNITLSDLFYPGTLITGDRTMVSAFYNCGSGIDPTVKEGQFWLCDTANYTVKKSAFQGCPAEVLSKIPTSWGGTNEKLEAEIQLRNLKVDTTDYTAFEFYPTNEVISADTVDSDTDLTYIKEVPANMIGALVLKTVYTLNQSDIVIDWGDGTVFNLSTMKSKSNPLNYSDTSADGIHVTKPSTKGEYEYQLRHTYTTPGKYIVRIFGKKYHLIYTHLETAKSGSDISNILGKSLVSRVFDLDLPIASCVTTITSLARASLKLLRIKAPAYQYNFGNIINASLAFRDCYNLQTVSGLSNKTLFFNGIDKGADIFSFCSNLISSDLTLPKSACRTSDPMRFYQGCTSLNMDILKLFPETGFESRFINANQMFANCPLLSCSNSEKLGQYLWDDPRIIWTSTQSAFDGCPLLSADVPETWR